MIDSNYDGSHFLDHKMDGAKDYSVFLALWEYDHEENLRTMTRPQLREYSEHYVFCTCIKKLEDAKKNNTTVPFNPREAAALVALHERFTRRHPEAKSDMCALNQPATVKLWKASFNQEVQTILTASEAANYLRCCTDSQNSNLCKSSMGTYGTI